MVPALESLVNRVDPDLGFRLLLRVMIAYRVPVDQARYEHWLTLGERFGYGQFHVDDTHFLTKMGRR